MSLQKNILTGVFHHGLTPSDEELKETLKNAGKRLPDDLEYIIHSFDVERLNANGLCRITYVSEVRPKQR